jgi:hypothetical protein
MGDKSSSGSLSSQPENVVLLSMAHFVGKFRRILPEFQTFWLDFFAKIQFFQSEEKKMTSSEYAPTTQE